MRYHFRLGSLFIFSLFISVTTFSQTDIYPGTWEMHYQPDKNKPGIYIELHIGNPEKNILYPAQLKIEHGSFKGIYHLLLVKKNKVQLGISRNKYPVSEEPFSLGNGTISFNNILNYRKINTVPVLSIQRLLSKQYGVIMPDLIYLDSSKRAIAEHLQNFLQNTDIVLTKRNPYPWMAANANYILDPSTSPAYFGIMDTIHIHKNTLKIGLPYNKKNDNDTVSCMVNGKPVLEEQDIRQKSSEEEIILEKGLNIVTFFADNYGKVPFGSGKLNITSGKKNMVMDFNNKADIASTFIVAKIYYYTGNEDSLEAVIHHTRLITEKKLQRATKEVGYIDTRSAQISLALWDDAVEDGDSISLNINGKWLVQGFAVRKQPQFITVTLEPGPNQIIFIADNLGSISPNTSVLEIIDGKKRKSFKIDTNYNQNNGIKIFYDFEPGK